MVVVPPADFSNHLAEGWPFLKANVVYAAVPIAIENLIAMAVVHWPMQVWRVVPEDRTQAANNSAVGVIHILHDRCGAFAAQYQQKLLYADLDRPRARDPAYQSKVSFADVHELKIFLEHKIAREEKPVHDVLMNRLVTAKPIGLMLTGRHP